LRVSVADILPALVAEVPRHLEARCRYYACKLTECAAFKSETCATTDLTADAVKLRPCTPQFVCYDCLGLPPRAVRGCFDMDYDLL
jgi:hypothetical protein